MNKKITDKLQASKAKRDVIFKRAEAYVKEYHDAEREQIRLKRLAKKEGNYHVEAEPKLVFVIRIKGYSTAISRQTNFKYQQNCS